MKKFIPVILAILLSACTSVEQTKRPPVALSPPEETAPEFFRMSPALHYYVDMSSILAEPEQKHIVHFDTVINLHKGGYLFPDPTVFVRSIRQSKVLNCQNHQLKQLKTNYYSEFWGAGQHTPAKKQREYIIKLRPGSSLYTLSEVICVNVMR
ncbi:surface-adhesin E family protein [Bisgaard Taxon 10/6]|uniref:Surface-adhesin E family protein n=1 Tax=Exercitatus varius TaxID=67857 RepID=A0AAW6Q8U3_9PAST|nr:surface-adhesin E family protein [Exercitatus varius]MDG2917497.1 surface-adhesin E family protein [Exercitatus varius]MDG2941913.1 surface-adhesin E family protein [Exercitatus varius]MDG2949773.1 surface-adhesin E family protein [Exercitatus varius]MDG2952379.1 surface-adhesin E family protein [Exercitatus varius]MDG2955984.1 surface-adhesin E family protein [Exercitatus varius]